MIKFGTGGWRAIIGDEFTKTNVQLLAAAMCTKMKKEGVAEKGIVIGYDRRFLSDEASFWMSEVFAAEGIPCQILDREAPTPLIMFVVKRDNLPYGMAVTASHNPALYNGVKIFIEGGRDADAEITDEIEEYIANTNPDDVKVVPFEKAVKEGKVKIINPLNSYIDSIISAINMDAIKEASLKVVLDPMFGVSKTSLQTILMTARCDVDVIHERHDALFGGRLPAPNTKTLASLTSYVVEHGCDIGIATDGDADRLGVIDDKGRFLHPNEILVLLYYYLMNFKGWSGPCVRNVATTHLLDAVAKDAGQVCYEVPVGFKYISGKMEESDAIIGGESSGGLTVKGHIKGKDGIYAASLLIEMMAVTGRSLSEIYKEITDKFGTFMMAEHDYRFSNERKVEIMKLLMEDKKLPEFPTEVEKVSYMDGCKVYFKNGGWIIARFSGTEPLIRIFCEMSTIEEAEKICATMQSFLGL